MDAQIFNTRNFPDDLQQGKKKGETTVSITKMNMIHMSKRRKTIKQAFQFAFSFWGGYRKKNMAGIVIVLVLCTNGLFASPIGYPASYTPAELLSHLFNGEYKADKKGGVGGFKFY